MRSGRLVLLSLLLLTAFGGWLRLRTVDSGLPQNQHYDEKFLLDELDLLRLDRPDARADPAYGVYPQLLPRLVLLFGAPPAAASAGPLAEQLERASRDLRLLRTFAVLLALLCVPCTWFLARRFLDAPGALLATALMSTSLLHVWYSGQARPHGPASGAIALALVGALAIRRHGTGWTYAWTAGATVLALGCSQVALMLLPSMALAHLLRRRAGSRRAHLWCLCAAALIACGAWFLCPAWFSGTLRIAPIEVEMASLTGRGAGRLALGLWHFEPWLSALALGGLLLWCVRRIAAWRRREPAPPGSGARFEGPRLLRRLAGREDLAIAALLVLPYLALILAFDRSAQRYFLPLLPCCAILASGFLQALAPRGRAGLAFAAGLLVFTLQAALAWRATAVLVAPDTSVDAARWIERELDPQRSRIATLPGLDLPLLRTAEARPRGLYIAQEPSPWARYQKGCGPVPRGSTAWKLFTAPLHGPEGWRRVRQDPLKFLRESGAEYVVVDLAGRPFIGTVVESLRSCTTLVARFSPMLRDEGDDTPFLTWDHQNEYQGGSWWIWRLLHARSMGSVLEIRRVPGAAPPR